MSSPATPLPIDAALPALREALAGHNRCLLVAQPGAGKTTRAPLALLDATAPERGRWLLLEPRRVAARLAASYMAEQRGEAVGQTVGYRVRGEQRVGPGTRLEVVTQGILTRMLQDDPLLDGVAGIIFDEFHERSLDADLGLALALDVQGSVRNDLKLLVMSATLDVKALLAVLGEGTPVIDCPGRGFPVATFHRPPPAREPDEIHRARVIREALASHGGDLLVFLPGQGEIRRLQRALEVALPTDTDIHPLHGQLTLAQQQAALRPAADGRRRVILSTAIAESSLTVPGVRVVIDAGLERVPVFQPRSGLTRLDTRRVNRASADQRRGRAGRVAEGFCYRLWSAEQPLAAHGEPEILQGDLSGLAFELARWGIADAARLDWVTPPPAAALASARQLLMALGLLGADNSLTARGRHCARWPTHPRLAVLLEEAAARRCLPLACWLVAWLEEGIGGDLDLLAVLEQRPRRDGGGDSGRWYRTARQWAARAGCDLAVREMSPLAALLASAYPDRVAQGQGAGRFKLVSGGQALVPDTHALARSPWLVAVELDGQSSGTRVFHGAAIAASDIEGLFPDSRAWRTDIRWDAATGRLTGEEVRGLGPLILERRPLARLPPEAVRAALLAALRERGAISWSAEDRQLVGRLALLRRVLGEPWPEVSDAHLLATLEQWLAPWLDGLSRLDQVDRLPLGRHLLDSLDWHLRQQLESLAPTHLPVPSGSRIAVDYSGDEPVLAVKLQELFGQTHTPTLVDGRVPVVLHLLSPARRPVQVTRDLASFWASTYFEVRKDLKGRYPRHPWPDDPLQAPATRHTKARGR
ncbi:MAG: ATP-dependent helicase HrpB [Porticoccaceae bacterium]|nr:ATP-dependent helicase HrpB [Porticoccaceae bacterium]HLS97888.1 ATP-dependent helicase HrpB [Porticoccaceae bacterium]